MSAITKIGFIFLLSFFCQQVTAQAYLEFVENKGQWEKQLSYKGDLTTGAFALKKDGGYRMLLYDAAEINALSVHQTHDQIVDNKEGRDTKKIIPNAATVGEPNTMHSHLYDVSFLNANPAPIAVPDKALPSYNNYFIGNDPSKWVSNCKLYAAITYKDLYKNIDVRYYSENGKLKYDFIVHPGGDVNQIALYFSGTDGLSIKDQNLLIKTSVQEVKELAPYSYQLNNAGKKEISCSYELKGNIVRFHLNQPINKNEILIIDPLIFSTYTGSTASNWGYTATYDSKGNFYAGGIVFGNGFPASVGAYSTSFSGPNNNGFDIAIMKFNSTGTSRVYATYLGGSNGSEQPHSLVVDANNNLIIAGRTSSNNYPGAKYGVGGGGWDIVLTKLNSTGSALIGSRIIGGSGEDGVNIKDKEICKSTANNPGCAESINRNYGDDARSEVIVDAAGNIYLSSCTQSTNFPTANAAQTTNGGRNAATGRAQDAGVLKFDPTLTTALFSTYLGGNDDDAAFVLALNPSNNDIYVAGATVSSDFPGDKTGSITPGFMGGSSDGFVAIFDNNGVLKKSTYFGTVGIDLIYGIQFDKFSFPYIMGTTTGDIPVTNAVFSVNGSKQFVTKLSQDLNTIIFSTNFGTPSAIPNISPTAFLIDRCENIYVSGWGGLGNTFGKTPPDYPSAGTKGLFVTPDAVLNSTDGSDFYFIVLEKNANSLKYGSFFGQNGGAYPDHVDGGTSRFDKNGIIYQAVCANCGGGARFPTSAGVWSQTNGALNAQQGGCNVAAIKIAFNLAGVGTDLVATINGRSRDTSGCVPLTVDFEDSLAMGKMYVWQFNDGTKNDTTFSPKISHVFTAVGTYRVKLISIDSTSCNIADSSYLNLRVRNDEAIIGFTATKLPPCASLSYQFTNISTPPVTGTVKPFKANSFLWIFGDGTTQVTGTQTLVHTFLAAGTYDVKLVLLDTNYCNKSDTFILQIRISPNVAARFTTPALGCLPYTAQFTNTSLAGQDFIWNFGDGSPINTQTSPSHLYASLGSYVVTLIAIDTNTCNKVDTTRFTITVSPKPKSADIYSPQPTEPNTAVSFSNNSLGGNLYKWIFGDGDSVVTSLKSDMVKHVYPATGTYNACLVTYNAAGCSDTACQGIAVTINPILDIPNAFSPNGDGNNDIIYIHGFGIEQMTWRIYDRWGNLVFATTSQAEGWNGLLNGKPLAQDVYHYTLQVEFSTKEKLLKKGDITLLR